MSISLRCSYSNRSSPAILQPNHPSALGVGSGESTAKPWMGAASVQCTSEASLVPDAFRPKRWLQASGLGCGLTMLLPSATILRDFTARGSPSPT